MNSDSLCSQAGQYVNPIPARFLALIDCLKIPAQASSSTNVQYWWVIKASVMLAAHRLIGRPSSNNSARVSGNGKALNKREHQISSNNSARVSGNGKTLNKREHQN
jgi:hypothetical protein